MFTFKFIYIFVSFFFNGSDCQRRIKDGEVVAKDKPYVVYFSKAAVSPRYYEGWLCGGALVSPEYIVTSAACVTDVNHLYAIAGYNKYVKDTKINDDYCTKDRKKKVILTCVPKAYELKYEEIEKWSYIDIAVVKVESPYDFNDKTYLDKCSYIPAPIIINYETKFQEPGIDAMVMGWGHRAKWRKQLDPKDYNEEKLNYAPTLIQNKEDCKKEYEVYKGMDAIIDNYMICTMDKGNINDAGETIVKAPPTAQGCMAKESRLRGYGGASCESANPPDQELLLLENTRKENVLLNNKTGNVKANLKPSLVNKIMNASTIQKDSLNVSNSRRMNTRRNGICQNDHGGPLVTWVGTHEVLIGVASVFKITEGLECIGPYLYTSTQCNGAFLDCILRSDPAKNDTLRRAICNNITNNGFELVQRHISWKNHPDGPAENEIHDIHAPTITNSSLINLIKANKSESHKENDTVIYNATKFIEDNLVPNLDPITKKVEITTTKLPTTNPYNATSPSTLRTTVDKNVTMTTAVNKINNTETTNSIKSSTTTVPQKLATK
ncbi:uncharacterized protein LOC118270771 [Spodoptera frugiperda]|uniref:Uncharacterized protein LOC118270771 n=1 Tax=Spodoptera frugiperda TaxID=7108 RepID=A0A9R0EL60_SPOFR|nr:uncharacterized protein LOC118270771 [Spodoptera frugiperda]